MKTKLAALVTRNSTDLSRDQAVAVTAWKHLASVISAGQHRLVLLDEITDPITWGWLEGAAVVDAITSRPPSVNVPCLGREVRAAVPEDTARYLAGRE